MHVRGDGVSRVGVLREQVGVDDFFFVDVHGAGGLQRRERIAVAGAEVEIATLEARHFRVGRFKIDRR